MSEVIRTVRAEEIDELYRFLERCYGFWRGFAAECYPDKAQTDEESLRRHLVIERDGRIVSHVAIYPMEVVIGPARVQCGGIGGVATLPEERGKGYMSRLMHESIRRMEEAGVSLSVLWGDQQRYQNFGYETCGVKYRLLVTHRGLQRADVEPAELREVDPREGGAVAEVRRLHAQLTCRVERPQLDLQLRRHDVRLFLGPGGYIITSKSWGGELAVKEIVSPDGAEAGMILSLLNMTYSSAARVEMGTCDAAAVDRLLGVASMWSMHPQGMLRIIDWTKLSAELRPLLEERLVGVQPFSVSVGAGWEDNSQWVSFRWDGEHLDTRPGREGRDVEADLGVRELTAAVFGGPHSHATKLGPLRHGLPVGIHFPELDHV